MGNDIDFYPTVVCDTVRFKDRMPLLDEAEGDSIGLLIDVIGEGDDLSDAIIVSGADVGPAPLDPESEDDDESGDEAFEVEEIIDRLEHGEGVTEYKVKWVGYGEEYNQWRTVDSMDCDQLIAEYEVKRRARLNVDRGDRAARRNELSSAMFDRNACERPQEGHVMIVDRDEHGER